jgi:hypothetical protein
MTTSALNQFANATLIFRVPGGNLVTNEVTGNVSVQSDEVTIRAYLKLIGRNNRRLTVPNIPGVDESSEQVDGYLCDPVSLPAGVKQYARGTATIGDRTGTFVLVLPTLSPIVFSLKISNITGRKIGGFFTIQA